MNPDPKQGPCSEFGSGSAQLKIGKKSRLTYRVSKKCNRVKQLGSKLEITVPVMYLDPQH